MRRHFHIILTSLVLSINVNAQVYTFEGNDTLYLRRLPKFDNFSHEIWQFKDDLETGKYFQIRKHDCGIDTLRQAEFSKKGVKDGIWMEWTESLCVAVDDESISTHTFTKSETYKHSETIFEGGYILKHTLYQLQSNQPLWELEYPFGSSEEDQWNSSKYYKENQLIEETRIFIDTASNKKIEFTTGYNKGGFKLFSDSSSVENRDEGHLIFYQKENQVLATGDYYNDNHGMSISNFKQYVFIGGWSFYNTQNEMAAKLRFRKGRLTRIKLLTNGVTELEIENWLNSLKQLP